MALGYSRGLRPEVVWGSLEELVLGDLRVVSRFVVVCSPWWTWTRFKAAQTPNNRCNLSSDLAELFSKIATAYPKEVYKSSCPERGLLALAAPRSREGYMSSINERAKCLKRI